MCLIMQKPAIKSQGLVLISNDKWVVEFFFSIGVIKISKNK